MGLKTFNLDEETYRKYKGSVYWGKVIDSWDRVTSSISLAAELGVGPGTLASAAEEVVEEVPKGLYSIYYALKTKDLLAVPYWAAAELASLLPFGIGDMTDFTNIYVNRARKRMEKATVKLFQQRLKSLPRQNMAA